VLGVGNKVINKTCKRVQGTKKRKSQARIWRKEKGTSDRVRDRTEPMSGQAKKKQAEKGTVTAGTRTKKLCASGHS